MNEWVYSIAVTVLITTAVSIILPDGKTGKLIKSIFSLIVILSIIKPIINVKDLLNTNINFNQQNSVEYQENYLDFTIKNKVLILEDNCNKIFIETGIYNADIKIDYQRETNTKIAIKKVKINLNNADIYSDQEHINIIEAAVNKVSDYLSVKREHIIVINSN